MDDFFGLRAAAPAAVITASSAGFVTADDHHIAVILLRNPDKQAVLQRDFLTFFRIAQGFYRDRVLARLRRREKLELHAIDVGFGAFRGPCFFLEGLSLLIKIDDLFVHILLVVLHLKRDCTR